VKTSGWLCLFLIGLLAVLFGWVNFGIANSANHEIVAPAPKATATLTSEQAAFEKLLQDNGGCELPCWWGLTLGKTKQEDWFKFLDQLPFTVFRVDPLSNGTMVPIDSGYFSFPQSISTSYLRYDFQDGMLSKVNIQLDRPDVWLSADVTAITFQGLLKQLNALKQTPEIYIFSGPASTLNLPFLVTADDIGVMAEYTFNIYDTLPAPNDLSQWRYCLGLDQTIRIEITVQDPTINPPVSAKQRLSIEAKEPPRWVRLEDWVTPMNTKDFIQFFIDYPDSCFVPKE
jgi:hypothetical protein